MAGVVAGELFSGGRSNGNGYPAEGSSEDADTQPLLKITGRPSRQPRRHLPQVLRAAGAALCIALIVASCKCVDCVSVHSCCSCCMLECCRIEVRGDN